MRRTLRPVIILLAGFLLYAALAPVRAAGQDPQAPERTLFKDLPPSDPKRQVLQEILNSPQSSMRNGFSSGEWTTGHYGGAWGRAQQYFPNHVYFTESDEYFMTHFFNPNGKLEMEIYNSAFLNRCIANNRTFTNGSVVSSYNRMLANDPLAAQSFQEKMGRLEFYFRDEASKEKLRKMLGNGLFNRLLEELRKENHHMLAGALMHEGMHAEMDDDQLVNRIQSEYKACHLPVQWDELRAYMAEINYHSKFYAWAVKDINSHWGDISRLLAELEAFRKRKKPLSSAEKERVEEIKAKIKAHIALIRLRMRELWQSAQRMNGLMGNFKNDYLKPDAPDEHRDMIDKIAASIAEFVKNVGQAIQQTEHLLRDLEQILDLWNEWASCKLPDPPDKKRTDDLKRDVGRIRWPAPPAPQAEEIKKKAEREIGKIPGSLPGEGPAGVPPGSPGGGRGSRSGTGRGFIITGGYGISSVSMKAVNGYLDYLNGTWLGNVPSFHWEHGFQASLGWRFSPLFEAGAYFERLDGEVTGTLEAVPSRYTSTHTLNVYGVYVSLRSDPILSFLRLVSQAGIGYYEGTYREAENDFVTKGTDHTLGWHTAAGLDIGLTGNLSLAVMAGYRSAVLDDFGVSFFSPGNPPVTLEFTGFVGRAGLSLRF